jgi:hypothetical protein
MAMVLEPKWLYLFRVRLTGECWEYVQRNTDLGYCAPGDLDGWYTMIIAALIKEGARLSAEVDYTGK